MAEKKIHPETHHEDITLAGILVPDKWEKNGEVTGLALLTNDEKKYVIHSDNTAEDIIQMLRQNILISGQLKSIEREEVLYVTRVQPVSHQNNS